MSDLADLPRADRSAADNRVADVAVSGPAAQPVLLIEDSAPEAALTRLALSRARPGRFAITHANDLEAAQAAFRATPFAVILLDLSLGATQGLEALDKVQSWSGDATLIVFSGSDDEVLALESVRRGAQDYLVKQLTSPELLARAVAYALERRQLVASVEKAHAEVERLAMTDALTGLPNRRALDGALHRAQTQALRAGSQTCVALIDCDHFKGINDEHGHGGGDAALRALAGILASTLRPADVVGRIGGDEFLAIFPATRIGEALAAAERLRTAVAERSIEYRGALLPLRVSVGVAPLPLSAVAIDDVLPLASRGLSACKAAGRDQVRSVLVDRGMLMSPTTCDPATAIEHLRPHAQAILSLLTSEVAGYELLTRGPEGPCEMPVELFQRAHEQEMLVEADLRCLATCVGSCIDLPRRVMLHFNVFPATLTEVAIDRLLEVIAPIGLQRVCLELSEQQLMGAYPALAERVVALREHGVRFALDDVGFGRGSLESLIVLEPETVKIDRGLVTGIAHNSGLRRHLARLHRLAQHLGAGTIVKGLETEADCSVARGLGIELGQGYLLSRPQPTAMAATG